MANYRCITKKEFAARAGISTRTLRKWLRQHEQTLTGFGQKKFDNYLLPQTVRFLTDFYVVT